MRLARGRTRRRCFAEHEPSILACTPEFSLAWKPASWHDAASGGGLDFLGWVAETWAKSAGFAKVHPFYRLGCRHSGVSLLAASPLALEGVQEANAKQEVSTTCAMLVQGCPATSFRRDLQLTVLRSSEGLRHGRLSLVLARIDDAPVSAATKIRRLLREEGHPVRGPLGGNSWNAQMTVVGLSVPGLSAEVPPPAHLGDMIDLDARRLRNRQAPLAVSASHRLFDAEGNGEMTCNGMRLRVNQKVFVPRGESRHLLQAVMALKIFAKRHVRILDLTLGAGNMLLSLLTCNPSAMGFGIDISPAAIALATENIQMNELEQRATLAVHDLCDLSSLTQPDWPSGYDIIVANPPYSPDRSCRLDQHAKDLEASSSHAKLLDRTAGRQAGLNGVHSNLR